MSLERKYQLLMDYARHPGRKKVSAMVRVKNEEAFLYAAVQSIVDHVDEIVLVDNQSVDDTPSIIAALGDEYPNKVVCYAYPYEIRKVGREHWEWSTRPETHASPHLSSTYYTWCLRRCTMPYVLKWDGDMVATEAFYLGLEAWRRSEKPIMAFQGMNVHPDRKHLLAAKCSDRDALLARLSVPGLPKWVLTLTYDAVEPRLFPRRFASYGNGTNWTQVLSSPCTERPYRDQSCYTVQEPCFLHLKFCKPDPLSNYSADLKAVIASNMTVGPPLSAEARRLLQRWHVEDGPRPSDPVILKEYSSV